MDRSYTHCIYVPSPRRCLTWDTASRITPNDALRHPFFAAARPQVSIAPYVEYPTAYPMTPQVRGLSWGREFFIFVYRQATFVSPF